MIKKRAKVAFIVVCWNNKDLLKGCIDSILNQTYKAIDIYVIDNKSSDGSVDYIKKEFKKVKLIENNENSGFAKGNNIAIREALKDDEVSYIALLNSDAVIRNDWTQSLVEFSHKRPKTAALQSVTLDYYDHSVIDSTHIYIAPSGQGSQGSHRRPIPDGFDVAPQRVFGCNAAAVMYTRNFVNEISYNDEFFDESFFMYLEDVDIAARATVTGWFNYVVPGTRAYHMGSASSGKKPGMSLYYTYRNNSALLFKNLPMKLLWKTYLKTLKADWTTFWHLRREGHKKSSWIIPRARIIGILRIPIYYSKRKSIQSKLSIEIQHLKLMMRSGH
jgi:GT2 family glycosyltransferase